jgi:hypothetical protein
MLRRSRIIRTSINFDLRACDRLSRPLPLNGLGPISNKTLVPSVSNPSFKIRARESKSPRGIAARLDFSRSGQYFLPIERERETERETEAEGFTKTRPSAIIILVDLYLTCLACRELRAKREADAYLPFIAPPRCHVHG